MGQTEHGPEAHSCPFLLHLPPNKQQKQKTVWMTVALCPTLLEKGKCLCCDSGLTHGRGMIPPWGSAPPDHMTIAGNDGGTNSTVIEVMPQNTPSPHSCTLTESFKKDGIINFLVSLILAHSLTLMPRSYYALLCSISNFIQFYANKKICRIRDKMQ